MKVATYNLLKGGSQRVHWVRMIEDFDVDLLLVQEPYPHHEHLPTLSYPNAGKQSAWEMAEKNGWGAASFPAPARSSWSPSPSSLAGSSVQKSAGRPGKPGLPTLCWLSVSTHRQGEKP